MRLPILPTLAAIALSAAIAWGPAVAAPAADCAGSPDDWIAQILEKGSREAYRCVASSDAAGPALLARIQADDFDDLKNNERVTRALAIHLIHRLDAPLPGDALRALDAPDRRLLRDAVYARRGRKSPSPQHHAVFEQFEWYQPSPSYNNGALHQRDRENLALIDDPPAPPAPPAPPSAAEAMAETAAPPAQSASGCGCATGGLGAAAALAWLPALVVARRRV